MNTRILAPLFYASLLVSTCALAADGKVTILSPANDAMVSTDAKVELSYEATPGSDGDHLHLYLDGKRIDVIHPMKGTAEVGMLKPGKHHICMTVNAKGHAPVSPETCIDVTAK